jgi:Sulfotransferase domain
MTILAMWSGPRNISTAMMYSFGNRADCTAWDEPFYGFSLKNHGNDHPMRDEIMAATETDWEKLVLACSTPAKTPIFYQKHMTHHMLPGQDRRWINHLTNAFLIRQPEQVLASYTQKWADVSLRDIGFVEQAEIFDQVCDAMGKAPAVIAGETVLQNPETALPALCVACAIPFDPAMLAWPKGPKSFDGVWAPHWYNAVWQSTGFTAPTAPQKIALSPALQRIADAAQPYYEKLKAHAIGA